VTFPDELIRRLFVNLPYFLLTKEGDRLEDRREISGFVQSSSPLRKGRVREGIRGGEKEEGALAPS